ncbi:nitroreductase family protein [Paramuribaculum intestinale]|uniref:nitroreductase family protein n=1 Tax=Paramuribaculum intestinale TaxID=2094151 RepID=UPI00259CEBF6|nr:nitroreductase family protein [Paramuribaculum intestinale]
MKSNAYPQLYRLCEQRYSCRAYSDRKVERDTVLTILDIVRLAPSACNRQPWKFLVADSDEQRAAILSSYDREWIRTASEFIVACGIHDEAWHRGCDGKDHTDVDVSIAVEHLCLAATSLGLGTCWVCNFDPKAIAEAFGLPEGVEPVAIIPLGYPAEGVEVPAKKRKELDEIVKWGRF